MPALTRCLLPRRPFLPSRRNRFRRPLWEALVSVSRQSSIHDGAIASSFHQLAGVDASPLAGASNPSRVSLKSNRVLDGRINNYGLEHTRLRRHQCRQIGTSSYTQSLSIRLNRHQFHSFNTTPHRHHFLSTLANNNDSDSDESDDEEILGNKKINHGRHSHHPCHPRLLSLRNVGIFAHVDAGKTTVTERMLALSGLVRDPGSVDDGDTVTDYLPAERERGITIQSAAVGFDWLVPPASTTTTATASNNNDIDNNDDDDDDDDTVPTRVAINLIDTPGHVDFSVEVHRSVAVLDGAVLVVDAVAGVQAQTETVWRAIRNTDTSPATTGDGSGSGTNRAAHGSHAHEPLPALMFINKMDREGADFRHAIDTVRRKLKGSNPVVVQLPLYRKTNHGGSANGGGGGGGGKSDSLGPEIVAGSLSQSPPDGEFIGMIDLVHMRAIIYPDDAEDLSMEDAVPSVISLHSNAAREGNPRLIETAMEARRDLISNLADVDEIMEDLYLHAEMEEPTAADDETTTTTANNASAYRSCHVLSNISTEQIRSSLRRMALSRMVMPTMCGAALRGVGVEPVLDCVAEYLPCPLDRLPPQLQLLGNPQHGKKEPQKQKKVEEDNNAIALGHPLHPSTLAYVFKVLHMKGRGGSGDGRVAFARVYSGTLKARDSVRVISPNSLSGASNGDGDNTNDKNKKRKFPVSKIGGMLELSGGQFNNLPEGSCRSGDVCALVGLKGVVTGDTLLLTSAAASLEDTPQKGKKKSGKSNRKNKGNNSAHHKQYADGVHLAGLASPLPVLTLRLEASSSSEQARLSSALALLVVEDPSLVVEETPTTTHISGLGELHVEIVLDRLRREYGLEVRTGTPRVTYRETVLLDDGDDEVESDGMVVYDRTVGGVQLQGAVRLRLSRPPTLEGDCIPPEDPVVTLSPETCEYFSIDPKSASSSIDDDESLEHKYPPALRALLSGARGSLKRGRLGPHPLANLECHILEVDSELASSDASFVGAMRAAAANAVTTLLESLVNEGRMVVLEPKMNVEISVPTGKVGDVLSDLTGRRGMVDDVAMAEEGGGGDHVKSMVRAEVPLIEILGYANSLRSLTGGEGAFSAEYKGHAPQDGL